MINILRKGLKEMFSDIKNRKFKKQIANILTFSRFFSPFILLPLYYTASYKYFIIMIVLFFLTDTFDGYFARKYNSVSIFGRYLDAFVDKIFVLTILIPTINLKIIVLLFLELIISIVNLYAYFKRMHPKTLIIGKIKTTFLFITIGLLYLNKLIDINEIFVLVIGAITIILQILTIISCILCVKKNKFS